MLAGGRNWLYHRRIVPSRAVHHARVPEANIRWKLGQSVLMWVDANRAGFDRHAKARIDRRYQGSDVPIDGARHVAHDVGICITTEETSKGGFKQPDQGKKTLYTGRGVKHVGEAAR